MEHWWSAYVLRKPRNSGNPVTAKTVRDGGHKLNTWRPVASLTLVSPGAVTDGDTLYVFLKKVMTSFSVVVSGVTRVGDTLGGNWGCHSYFFNFFTWRPFFCSSLSLSLSLVTPHLFYLSDLVSPLFFVNLPKKYSFGCHPLEGVIRGGPPPPPSDATGRRPQKWSWLFSHHHHSHRLSAFQRIVTTCNRLSNILCKFCRKKIILSLGCHPLDGVTRAVRRLITPPMATKLNYSFERKVAAHCRTVLKSATLVHLSVPPRGTCT